jgi:hypothetical protein
MPNWLGWLMFLVQRITKIMNLLLSAPDIQAALLFIEPVALQRLSASVNRSLEPARHLHNECDPGVRK